VRRTVRSPAFCEDARRLIRVNPAFVKDRKNSGFSKKPGKRRLARSTQFSRNRNPGLLQRRTPFRRRHFCQTQSKDRTFSISVLRPFRQGFSGSEAENFDGSRSKDPRKDLEPLWGCAI